MERKETLGCDESQRGRSHITWHWSSEGGGAELSQTGVLVPLQGPVLKCECCGSRGDHLGREESLQLRITLRECHKAVGGRHPGP